MKETSSKRFPFQSTKRLPLEAFCLIRLNSTPQDWLSRFEFGGTLMPAPISVNKLTVTSQSSLLDNKNDSGKHKWSEAWRLAPSPHEPRTLSWRNVLKHLASLDLDSDLVFEVINRHELEPSRASSSHRTHWMPVGQSSIDHSKILQLPAPKARRACAHSHRSDCILAITRCELPKARWTTSATSYRSHLCMRLSSLSLRWTAGTPFNRTKHCSRERVKSGQP